MVTNNKPEGIEELRRGQEAILAGLSDLREAILKAQSEFNQRLDAITDLFRQQILEAPKKVGLEDEIPAMGKNPGAFNTSINKLLVSGSPYPQLPAAICAKKNPVPIKFGMITETLDDDFVYDLQIYLVDVVAAGGVMVNEYHPIVPTAQFQFRPKGHIPTICAVKSTVYVFEGSKHFFRHPEMPPTPEEEKSAYKLVFSSGDELLRDIPPMNHFKGRPIALPTPDGENILVFSGRFVLKDSGDAFELLDIENESWTQLPPLSCRDSCTKSAESRCYCNSDLIAEVEDFSFIGDSQFFLKVQCGVFVLDLNKRKWDTLNKRKWATRIPEVVPDDHQGYFETVNGRYVLIPRRKPRRYNVNGDYDYDDIGLAAVWAYDFGEDVFLSKDAIIHDFRGENEHWCELSIFPRPYYPDYKREVSFLSILRPIEQEDGACTSRVVQIESIVKIVDSKELWHKARILVNVCRTDLATIETSVSNSVGLTFDISENLVSEFTFFNI